MRESLRVRLVMWYALVLTLVIALYGGAVCYEARRSALAGIDAELGVRAEALAAALRPVDIEHFDLELDAETLEYFAQEAHRPFYAIWGPTGRLVDRSDPDVELSPPAQPAVRTVQGRREVWLTAPSGARVLVGRDLAALRGDLRALGANVALAGAATLALAILAGWFVAGRALAPIASISRAARAMSAGDFSARIPVDRTETELEQVASSLNEAFDRLRQALDQQRQFAADASHELRTPVAVLRAEVEWALRRERGRAEYRQSLAVCARTALRMQETVERLLTLARAEADARPATFAPVPLQPLLDEIAAGCAPLAQERGISVTVASEPLGVRGDSAGLREAMNNIVANAILYNKPGGRVTISSRPDGHLACVEVADTGIGIPEAAMPHLFDRFFRADGSRVRAGGGAGLGLSIARAIVHAHGGTISCTSREGAGSRFVIRLPRDPR